jgi:hypothetical protein
MHPRMYRIVCKTIDYGSNDYVLNEYINPLSLESESPTPVADASRNNNTHKYLSILVAHARLDFIDASLLEGLSQRL